jgi:hypothetical protein
MAINETLNGSIINTEALNQTITKAAENAVVAHSFFALIFIRLWDLIAAPFRHGEMLWIIFPLFFTFLIMEFYYDRNRDEEMGWGAAIANSMILIFVAIDLIKTSYGHVTPYEVAKNISNSLFNDMPLAIPPQVLLLIIFLGALGIAVTLINYFHLLPRRVAFQVSGHPPINFLAYFAIAIVYSGGTDHPIPFDMATLIAGVLLFVLLLVIVFSIKRLLKRFVGES